MSNDARTKDLEQQAREIALKHGLAIQRLGKILEDSPLTRRQMAQGIASNVLGLCGADEEQAREHIYEMLNLHDRLEGS